MTNETHKFLSMYLFLFITLYTFRAPRAHHQERQIVSVEPLVYVTLCWWPCRVQVGKEDPFRHRVTYTRGCIDTICLSWWWARVESYKQKQIHRKEFVRHVGHLPRLFHVKHAQQFHLFYVILMQQPSPHNSFNTWPIFSQI